MKHVRQGREEESVEDVEKIMKCNKTNSCSQSVFFDIWLTYKFSLLSYFLKIHCRSLWNIRTESL